MQFRPACQDILGAIGNTPLVRLNRIFKDFPVEVWAKCEFTNPGGSVKDRIGYRMVEMAEQEGRIKPGDTLIEPTSGNTGIGIALAGAVKGYKVIITMPQKMSMEKQWTLEALGAQVIRTRTEAGRHDADSLFGIAEELHRTTPNSHILDQYGNPNNWMAHYEGTGPEIYEQMGGKIDYLVASAGTGGTITGCSRFLKEKLPNIKIVGTEPEGSVFGKGKPGPPYKVEGIGYDFIPDVLDLNTVDEWVTTTDGPTFRLARRLIKEEGLLVGGSAGSAMEGVMHVVNQCKGGERIAVILADGIRNYMTKFLSDDWMRDNQFV